ncbi:MAG TPA: CHRD domain-containing protein [Thermodesulfobacteriota bacterium]|nr:CHRD domain-containing protein [Thermodesulfobacteriota bacterium]
MTRVFAAAGAALALAGAAAGAGQDSYNLTATLRARFEVPRPTGVPAGAAGAFTGKAVELAGGRVQVTWRLTFSKLSGRAVAAHIHLGRPGRAGGVLAALCGPCRSGQRGRVTITRAQLRAIRAGAAYVNVHTARNPAGEIRGQLKATAAGPGSSGEPAPGPPPAPPPYPPYEP